MCFSATASFIAGITLSAVGIATCKKVKSKTELPFAMIPLLFGIQQLIEGIIWLTFRYDAPFLQQVMTYLYTVFSHSLWPIYVPFAIGVMETVRWRRKMIFGFQVVGIMLGLYLLYYIVTGPVVAEVTRGHITYVSPHFYQIPVMILYITAACISCFISSHVYVKIFGGLLLVSFITAYLIHIQTLISVWCFFAAILSAVIYLHLRPENTKGLQPAGHRLLLMNRKYKSPN